MGSPGEGAKWGRQGRLGHSERQEGLGQGHREPQGRKESGGIWGGMKDRRTERGGQRQA